MAVGDAVQGMSSVASSGYLTIQPTGTEQWVIHNIYWEDTVELYYYDGTNSLKFHADNIYGALLGSVFHVTNSKYIRVLNRHASSKLIGYDGVVTRL